MSIFNPTHRVLVKASEGEHTYDVTTIDIDSGFFKHEKVKQQLTKIRVGELALSETLPFNKLSKTLTLSESASLVKKFNILRVKKGFSALDFTRVETANDNK